MSARIIFGVCSSAKELSGSWSSDLSLRYQPCYADSQAGNNSRSAFLHRFLRCRLSFRLAAAQTQQVLSFPRTIPPNLCSIATQTTSAVRRGQKTYRQGEVFYARCVPSGGKYLTFRVPVLPITGAAPSRLSLSAYSGTGPDLCLDSELANDLKLIYDWLHMRPPDTALSLRGSIKYQSEFLKDRLSSQNSFPAIMCWNSTPLGYFKLFWVLEDPLGRSLDDPHDFDRGVRCFIGNEDFLAPTHLKRCMIALVHCWLYDQRTHTVVFEFRADNLD
ncbi:acyl-CoA N-acyltransferase [Aspergillus lucknowensis]|uniref:Acyl-CoA N-acyltransferase n=1 Tax=Aspergillus lucknowensis TaxID=176173 RepID=A0ABR4LXU7_9EURO